MRIEHLHFWVLFVFLILGGVVVNAWEHAGEAHVSRQALKDFPAELGAWRQDGADTRFDAETENALRADDYVLRNYALPDGRWASLYVGYYASQRSGATYHSPLNCLPGSGWTMDNARVIKIIPAGGAPAFEANRYLVQKDDTRELMIYWYQGRGRAVASEYWGKFYTVLDGVRRRRSDGAMVRILVPVGQNETEAVATAMDLAAQAAPLLPRFVPN